MANDPTIHGPVGDLYWKRITEGGKVRTPMTVKFIYREQVIQVIEGENSRKGELSVITRDKDVPAHEVEHTVRRIANAGTD